MECIHVVGARPNFMKAAPVISALSRDHRVEQKIVHTGQHYDPEMSGIFFQQLDLAEADVNLEVGSGSQALQTALIMTRFEKYICPKKPDLVIVYGDVNSTVAAALVCAKMSIPVAHVEAGLRSYDRSMPEEINRLLTDQVSDFLFTPSVDGNENLAREGIPSNKIHFVGNVMIDTLEKLLPVAEAVWPNVAETYGLRRGSYGLVTIHRPGNVDDPDSFKEIMGGLKSISSRIPLVFPVHPRTRKSLDALGFKQKSGDLQFVKPIGYLEILALQKNAAVVITDSGGIQEESTYLRVPCITMRPNTERPVTVYSGTNHVVGRNMRLINSIILDVVSGKAKKGTIPPLWDGQASNRIADVILQAFMRKPR